MKFDFRLLSMYYKYMDATLMVETLREYEGGGKLQLKRGFSKYPMEKSYGQLWKASSALRSFRLSRLNHIFGN